MKLYNATFCLALALILAIPAMQATIITTNRLQINIVASDPDFIFEQNLGNTLHVGGSYLFEFRPAGSYHYVRTFVFPGGTFNAGTQLSYSVDKNGNPANLATSIGTVQTLGRVFYVPGVDFTPSVFNAIPGGTYLEAIDWTFLFKGGVIPNQVVATGFIYKNDGPVFFKAQLAIGGGSGLNNYIKGQLKADFYFAPDFTVLIDLTFDHVVTIEID